MQYTVSRVEKGNKMEKASAKRVCQNTSHDDELGEKRSDANEGAQCVTEIAIPCAQDSY